MPGRSTLLDSTKTTALPIGNTTNSFTSFDLNDLLVGGRGIFADVTVSLDYINDINSQEFRSAILLADFVTDALENYPTNDFIEVINQNVAQSLFNDRRLGLSSVLDSLTITLGQPQDIPFPVFSTTTLTPATSGYTTPLSNQLISFELNDLLVGGRGISADVTVSLDYIDGINSQEFRSVILLADFVTDALKNYPTNDFLEVINQNVAQSLFNDRHLGLSSVLDSLTIQLGQPQDIPFPVVSTTTLTPATSGYTTPLSNQLISFELNDLLVGGRGISADVTVSLDYIDGINSQEFRSVLLLADFVTDALTNYPTNDFLEVINQNVAQSLFNDEHLGLSSVLDSLTIQLGQPQDIPFPVVSTTTLTPATSGYTTPLSNQLISFELDDLLVGGRGIFADVTVSLDYINGINSQEFRSVILLADFVTDALTNYPTNDFLEVINQNVAQSLFNDEGLGLSSVLDSLTITLGQPQDIPFPFSNTVTITPNDVNQLYPENNLALNESLTSFLG